eukprot:1053766-Pyramimonas_sp.AAC.1
MHWKHRARIARSLVLAEANDKPSQTSPTRVRRKGRRKTRTDITELVLSARAAERTWRSRCSLID